MREPARTRRQAQERYRRFLQLSLSCLDSTAHWYSASGQGPGEIAHLVRPQAVPLRVAGATLYLGSSQLYSIVADSRFEGEFKVSTRSYVYSLTPDAEQRSKLLAWHWHPQTRPDPHIHVHASHERIGALGGLHLPTARVSFESVIRFLIADWAVPPVREDWREVLDDVEQRFLSYRTWHHAHDPEAEDAS